MTERMLKAALSPNQTNKSTSAGVADGATGVADGATEDIWNIKTGLLKTTEEVCAQPHRWRRETLWWNEHVEKTIAARRKTFKAWISGRLVKALGHHTMQPNAMPDTQCTMLVKKPTRSSREY